MGNPITQADVGKSLSHPRVYDTQGQNSGGPNAELEADRIVLVHEMGGTIASEKMHISFRTLSTGAISQSSSGTGTATDLPTGPWKILGFNVYTESTTLAAQIQRVTFGIVDGIGLREVLMWGWNGAGGGTVEGGRFIDHTGLLTTRGILIPSAAQSGAYPGNRNPIIMSNTGSGRPQQSPILTLRAETNAFGAGTLEVFAIVCCQLMNAPGVPYPSW